MSAKTLYDKLWDEHVVRVDEHGTALLYIDRHLVHEVTSPQAFEGLRLGGRKPWSVRAPTWRFRITMFRPPTVTLGIADPVSRIQVETLEANCAEFGITLFAMGDVRQGIVHVVGPESGFTQPGMTIVCGDSHTSTHGAFGALAFGVGTSEVEHVLATQCLIQKKAKSMLVSVDGDVGPGVTAKDIVLAIIGEIGTAGGTGHVVEFGGEAIRDLSMEGRMTVCNMTIEAGARAGLIAVDEKTVEYVRGRPFAPTGALFEQAADYWRILHSDDRADFDRVVRLDAATIRRRSPGGRRRRWCVRWTATCRTRRDEDDPVKAKSIRRALHYMGLTPGTRDHRYPARQGIHRLLHQLAHRRSARGRGGGARGRHVAESINLAMVVPGSGLVKQQAEAEGLAASSSRRGSSGASPDARCAWR